MNLGNDQIYWRDGHLYVPVHSVPFAAGIFLEPRTDSIEQHVELPPEHEFRHGVRDDYTGGTRKPRRGLFAGWVYGNSMIDWGIRPGNLAVAQSCDSVDHGKIMVIENLGEEEGMGAWSLKRLIIEQPRSWRRNEFAEDMDCENPTLTLRSHNRHISSWQLHPSGQYRIRGVLLRWLPRERILLVDSDLLARRN